MPTESRTINLNVTTNNGGTQKSVRVIGGAVTFGLSVNVAIGTFYNASINDEYNFQICFFEFDTSDFPNAFLSIDQLDLNYNVSTIGDGSVITTATLKKITLDIGSAAAQPLYEDIDSSSDYAVTAGAATPPADLTSGAHTITLNSTALSDFATKQSTDALFGIGYESDVSNPGIGNNDTYVITDNAATLTVTYTVDTTVAPSRSNITVTQSSSGASNGSFVSSTTHVQYTEINTASVASTLFAGDHTETQYQIFENHQPISQPLITLSSKSNIRNNGNVTLLTKDKLRIKLTNNTTYKIRMRFRGNTWTDWTPLNTFKTRDKDYKRIT